MRSRLIAVFAALLLCFAGLSCSLLLLSSNTGYAQAAAEQSTFYLPLEKGRGNFFDCNFRKLTSATTQACVLAAPTIESYRALFDVIPAENRPEFYDGIQKSTPFLMPLAQEAPEGYPVFEQTQRYGAQPIAAHLIGYCNGDGVGVSGLEAVYNNLLEGGSTKEEIYCAVNARGALINSETPRILPTQGTGNGIMLTLDAALQRACESIAAAKMKTGAIVVMETTTGRIRACVSAPSFDSSNPAGSMNAQNSPLLNRAISSYNVGSVFKPLLAAAALENNLGDKKYTCTGAITVGGHVYRCAHGKGHGEVDLKEALAQSCNCYFVDLGLVIGGERLVKYAESMGFGSAFSVAPGLEGARGNFPTAQELENLGELSGVSFGQGTLLASPVQIAAFMNVFANGGSYISPTFIEGVVNEYTHSITESQYAPVRRQCLAPQTAQQVSDMLINVVQNGLGKSAAPQFGGAGGKTGTAQTGRFSEDGKEQMDAWFAGFYPAQQPQYTIVVMLDSGSYSGEEASQIFADVANALHYFVKTEPVQP